MKVKIKKGAGIIKELANKEVKIHKHPKYKNLYQFEYENNKYIASDYCFDKNGDCDGISK